jgi:uncharacterized protein
MEIVRDPLAEASRPSAHHYRPGELGVLGKTYTASVILTPAEIIDDWPPQSAAAIAPVHLERLLGLNPRPEMVLLGTGEKQIFPQHEVLAPLARVGVSVEVMDTRAACRTWNIVLSEDRRAAAALIV